MKINNMKNNIAIILTTVSLSAATSSTFAASDNYIPWTFDDFDSNCEVIDTTTTLAVQDTYVLPVISEDDEVGELGW